eukprot:8776889-Pyramimonas_sp.AAC.1
MARGNRSGAQAAGRTPRGGDGGCAGMFRRGEYQLPFPGGASSGASIEIAFAVGRFLPNV